jgi:hypothetical protein
VEQFLHFITIRVYDDFGVRPVKTAPNALKLGLRRVTTALVS